MGCTSLIWCLQLCFTLPSNFMLHSKDVWRHDALLTASSPWQFCRTKKANVTIGRGLIRHSLLRSKQHSPGSVWQTGRGRRMTMNHWCSAHRSQTKHTNKTYKHTHTQICAALVRTLHWLPIIAHSLTLTPTRTSEMMRENQSFVSVYSRKGPQ